MKQRNGIIRSYELRCILFIVCKKFKLTNIIINYANTLFIARYFLLNVFLKFYYN